MSRRLIFLGLFSLQGLHASSEVFSVFSVVLQLDKDIGKHLVDSIRNAQTIFLAKSMQSSTEEIVK